MKHLISGFVQEWNAFQFQRKYATLTLRFEIACDIFKVSLYNGKTGEGEQREVQEAHSRKLQKEIRNGMYTPTPIAAGTYQSHRNAMKFADIPEGKAFTLEVDTSEPLPLTDGHHRFHALNKILIGLAERLKTVKDAAEKDILSRQMEEIYSLPITCILYLDGDPQTDFINLQLGRNVDTSHILTMRIRRSLGSSPEMASAYEIAKVLAAPGVVGPYVEQIRFDSRGKMPLPISTLCSKGSSDLSTSLVGLAKVAKGFDVKEVAGIVNTLYSQMRTKCPEVMEYGKILTNIGAGGTKGSATMLIGVAICLVHDAIVRCASLSNLRYADAIDAAKETLDGHVAGSFTSSDKRRYMRLFAEKFFEKCEVNKFSGVPVSLTQTLSGAAYACGKADPKKAEVEAEAEPVDMEVVVAEQQAIEQPSGQQPAAEQPTPAKKSPAAKKTAAKGSKKAGSAKKAVVASNKKAEAAASKKAESDTKKKAAKKAESAAAAPEKAKVPSEPVKATVELTSEQSSPWDASSPAPWDMIQSA